MMKIQMVSWLLLLTLVPALAEYRLDVKTTKAPTQYEIDENICFQVRVLDGDSPMSNCIVSYQRSGDDRYQENGEVKTNIDGLAKINVSTSQPGFVKLHISVHSQDGTELRNPGMSHALGGVFSAAAAVERIAEYPEPVDFDVFWKKQKERLAAEPMRELARVDVSDEGASFRRYDIKISCPGPKPVSAYLVMPRDAKEKSLPAIVFFFGYGVYSPWDNSYLANGNLVLSVNAHGMENGRPESYYQQLRDGELAGYAFNEIENQDPEKTYFNGMILRAMRALEYVKTLPEWNGKDLILLGHSQGGMQTIIAGGLDSDVTLVDGNQPWMCDIGGFWNGHSRGNWFVKSTPALLYYDPVYHVKRYRGEIKIQAGLSDEVCPPTGMALVYRNAPGKAQITYSQGTGHTPQPVGESFIYQKKAR